MPYAEIIFETGSESVLSFSYFNELKQFVQNHHTRAMHAEPGGTAGPRHPAERVKKVLVYDNHPGESDGIVSASDVTALLEGKDEIPYGELSAALRDAASPVHTVDQGRHASQYKTQ